MQATLGHRGGNQKRFPRAARTAAIGIALAFSSGNSAASEPVQVFRCQLNLRLDGGGYEDVRASKSFREDGAVNSMFVTMTDNMGAVVRKRRPEDQAIVELNWPGQHRIWRDEAAFDWSSGSIQIGYFGRDNPFQYQSGETWRQTVVDRDRSILVHESDGVRMLFLSGLEFHLMSELNPRSSLGHLRMGIDAFLAWGNGAQSITVFETLVRRAQSRSGSSDSLAGRRRIIAEYDVDMAALARTVARVHEAVSTWETEIASTWRQCERTTEGGDIIVTEAIPRTGAQAS